MRRRRLGPALLVGLAVAGGVYGAWEGVRLLRRGHALLDETTGWLGRVTGGAIQPPGVVDPPGDRQWQVVAALAGGVLAAVILEVA